MRKFFVLIILFLGMMVVIFSFSELSNTLDTLRKGDFWYLLLAFAIQLGWFFLVGITYRSIYRLLGMQDSILNLTLLSAAATFVNTVMPTAGVSGIAVFINVARKRGQPSGKVTLAAALFLLFDEVAFLALLALGMLALFRRGDLNAGEVGAALILMAVASLLATSLYLGSRSVEAMGNFLARLARLVNAILRPFIHRDYLHEERAHEFSRELAEGLAAMPDRPRGFIKPMFLAFLNKGLLVTIFLSAFLAFHTPYTAGTIFGGFAIGYMFNVVSPTPAGIGIVEGVLPLGLSSLRVPWSDAVLITLTYRAFTFWIPLAVGGFAFRILHLEKNNQNGETE
jgi:uncharacterized protein (TIRG00374 family)